MEAGDEVALRQRVQELERYQPPPFPPPFQPPFQPDRAAVDEPGLYEEMTDAVLEGVDIKPIMLLRGHEPDDDEGGDPFVLELVKKLGERAKALGITYTPLLIELPDDVLLVSLDEADMAQHGWLRAGRTEE